MLHSCPLDRFELSRLKSVRIFVNWIDTTMLFLIFVLQFIIAISSYEIKVTRVSTEENASPYGQKNVARTNLVPFDNAKAADSKAQLVVPGAVTTGSCSTCIQAAVIEINLLANQILNGVLFWLSFILFTSLFSSAASV
jgi:hypothetical protein